MNKININKIINYLVINNYLNITTEEKENIVNDIFSSNSINPEQTKINFSKNYLVQSKEKLEISNRRYLGSKTKLIKFIKQIIDENCSDYESFFDVFGGTGIVSSSFNKKNVKIIINDLLSSNYISYQTWLGFEPFDKEKIKNLINKFNSIESVDDNYVSHNFGGNYFTYFNAKLIGYIREEIETLYSNKDINFREKCILLTSLVYALDKVANTCGHYDAFRKKLDSNKRLEMQIPKINDINNKNNEIYKLDSNQLVRNIYADIVYIDPPYNSRQYGDAYHLLENIVDWKQSEVYGVAKKMKDRNHLKSSYCTVSAPCAFKDLIENLNCKYILVSYNNMGEKGAGRSQAKISDQEIIDILTKKGEVSIFEEKFQFFTTGKSKIEDHKERIFLCKVNKQVINLEPTIPDNQKKNEEVIKSPLNYTGGKSKLFKQIKKYFPDNIDKFYDIFTGGANIGVNVEANKIICIDKEKIIIDLYNLLKNEEYNDIIFEIENIINTYSLSNTFKNSYEHYNVESSEGLGKFNREAYLKLRNDFNVSQDKHSKKSLLLFFTLIIFGFNNQIRFNKKGEMNIPVGKRDFNNSIRKKLKLFMNQIKNKNINFISKDFKNINISEIEKNDFLYLDPPYLIANATYNENGLWTENDEKNLYDFLEKINQKKIKFALSNVLIHKSKENILLKEWCLKNNFKINYLDFNYNNSNYQKSDKSLTEEILITNY